LTRSIASSSFLVGYQRAQVSIIAAIRRSTDGQTGATEVPWKRGVMTTPVTVRGRDLRALADIVSEDRPDLPNGEGLPPSLLADLMNQIRCDQVVFLGFDGGRQGSWWFTQEDPFKVPFTDTPGSEDLLRIFWEHYGKSQFSSYPSRTGDLRSIIKVTDFHSVRQWHSTAMYTDYVRALGLERHIMLCLPEASPRPAAPGRHVRLVFSRGSGPDFSERDRAVLTLLRPHLHRANLDAERRRHPVPRLTPRQWELLRLLAAGYTNSQIARRLGVTEGTVRTHLENIYERLHVSSRTAAVTRAFPDRAASSGHDGRG
jgi:DNA-binding CsgD family transcriptional regulator